MRASFSGDYIKNSINYFMIGYLAILETEFLSFSSYLLGILMCKLSPAVQHHDICFYLLHIFWGGIPSSLVIVDGESILF